TAPLTPIARCRGLPAPQTTRCLRHKEFQAEGPTHVSALQRASANWQAMLRRPCAGEATSVCLGSLSDFDPLNTSCRHCELTACTRCQAAHESISCVAPCRSVAAPHS